MRVYDAAKAKAWRAKRRAENRPVRSGTHRNKTNRVGAQAILCDSQKHKARSKLKAFIAIDGEGETNKQTGIHLYTLLAASTGESIRDSRGLSTQVVFRWLIDLAKAHPKSIFIIYGGSYDANMWLRNLHREVLQDIWEQDTDSGVNVSLSGKRTYSVSFRPRKSFKLRSYKSGESLYLRDPIKRTWSKNFDTSITVWDVIGFFQKSFVEALTEYDIGTESERGLVAEMKKQRGSFDAAMSEKVSEYNALELRLLVDLMNRLRDLMLQVGLHLRAWHGTGAIASELFRMHKIKEHLSRDVPLLIRHAAFMAFSGGRIEMMKIGRAHKRIYSYDIRSAYPAQIAKLPCLACGVWRSNASSEKRPSNPPPGFTLVKLGWDFSRGAAPWYPLFKRLEGGSIAYDQIGSGWYWFPEYELALAWHKKFKTKGSSIKVLGWYHYETNCGHEPFAFVRDMFATRLEWKRANNPAQNVLRLGLNSLYGKMAQQLGFKIDRHTGELIVPPYFQIEWAGYVTSGTRAIIGAAMLESPEQNILCMTDGIYSLEPLGVDTRISLGAWDAHEYDDMITIAAGVYYLREGDSWTCRYRGFDRESIEHAHEDIQRAWKLGIISAVKLPSTRFITLGSALASPSAMKAWCSWHEHPRRLSLRCEEDAKRMMPSSHPSPAAGMIALDVRPHPSFQSVPYTPRWEKKLRDAQERIAGVPLTYYEQEHDDTDMEWRI